MGARCPTCGSDDPATWYEPIKVAPLADLDKAEVRIRELEAERDRCREALEQGITGVENLPQLDAEKYLIYEWLPRARQALTGGDEDG